MPPIETITTLTTITADLYNRIAQTATDVLVGFYSVTNLTALSTVEPDSTISLSDWESLNDHISRCLIHQTNTGTEIQTFTKVRAVETNKLIRSANQIWEGRHTIDDFQLRSTSSQSTRVASWNTPMNLGATFSFLDSDEASIFFKQGGRIDTGNIAIVSGQLPNDDGDLTWSSAIDTIKSNSGWTTHVFTLSNYLSMSNGDTMILSSGVGEDAAISVKYTKVSSTAVKVDYDLVPSSPAIICDYDIEIMVRAKYSRVARTGRESGIGGIIPSISAFTGNWGDPGSGQVAQVKTLEFGSTSTNNQAAPITFGSVEQGTNSETKQVWVKNTGNVPLTISTATFTALGGASAQVVSWINDLVLSPGEANYFSLRFINNNVGTYTNTVSLIYDSQFSPLLGYVKTQTTATPPPPIPTYSISLDPASVSQTINSLANSFFSTNILETNGSHTELPLVTLSVGSPFTVANIQQNNISVKFNPSACPGSGTYSTVMTVVTTSTINQTASATKSFVINYTQPLSQHLGSWLSPIQNNNGVIGMSYDIIANNRYLTIGLGMGDTNNEVSGGGAAQATTSTLGISGDTGFELGPVMYSTPSSVTWHSFLNTYGVWVRPASIEPSNVYINRNYQVVFPSSGTYSWQLSVDFEGYVKVGGQLLGNVGLLEPWKTVQTGDIQISTVSQTIELWMKSKLSTAGIAFRIYKKDSGEEVWNTRYPVRSEAYPYRYWTEVYRIPIGNTAVTYKSKNHILKDYGMVKDLGLAKNYGKFFGAIGSVLYESVFAVTNDSFGNLAVSIPPKLRTPGSDTSADLTLTYLSELFYYYSQRGERISNLDPLPAGDGTQTRVFTGFNVSGQVQTRLDTFPGAGSSITDGVGSGDTGDSGDGL